jgi:hypothetical protein
MPALIDELRIEHAKILDTLNEVVKRGVGGVEAQEYLKSMKSGLLEHLKKEDELLYPALREEAAKRKELKRLLESAPKDMEAITLFAFTFFDKYSSGGSGFEFEGDFKILIATLRNRILNEENIFFDEYESLNL